MTPLPHQFQFLLKEPGPRVLLEFLKLYGTKEVPGPGDNPAILGWVKELGPKVGMNYNHDSIPWCGIGAGIVIQRAGFIPPDICARASSFDNWGLMSVIPMLGDILRFERAGGGHVGIYVGEDDPKLNLKDPCYYVLGANQGDAVKISPIEKSRLVAARRCPWKLKQPENVRRIFVGRNGEISKNEQ